MAWDGSELLLWGGVGVSAVVPGGFTYDPRQNRWAAIPPAPLPSLGLEVSSAWTGHQLIVWGTEAAHGRSVGAMYDPATKKWTVMAAQSTVAVGAGVWTGNEWVVVGEDRTFTHVHAAAYDPETDTWRALQDPPTPEGPGPDQVLVWTGKAVLLGIPAGQDHAIAYDPTVNRWTALAPSPAGALTNSNVAWTGEYLMLTGGSQVPPGGDVGHPVQVAALYDPVKNAWTGVPEPPHPVNRGIPVDHRVLFPGRPTLTYEPATRAWSDFPTPPGVVTIWTGHDLWSVGVGPPDRKSVVLYRYQPTR